MEHNGTDTTEIKCPLYSRSALPPNRCMTQMLLFVLLKLKTTLKCIYLVEPLHSQELVKDYELFWVNKLVHISITIKTIYLIFLACINIDRQK